MKNPISYISRIYRSIAVTFVVLSLSCNQSNQPYGHPAYFDQVFSTAERISTSGSRHAPDFIDSAFNAFPNADIKDLYRKYVFKSHYFIEVDKQFNMALLYADSALWSIRDHIGEKEFLNSYGSILATKSFLLMEQKDYTAAFECSYKARQVVEKTNDTCLLSDYTLMLGSVSDKQGKYLDAARYVKQALQEMSHCHGTYQAFRLTQAKLDDAGIFYSRAGMPDSALYYYKAAFDYLQQHEDSFSTVANHTWFVAMAKAIVQGNMGDAYYKKGDTAMAEDLYKQSIQVNSQQGYDASDAQLTRLKLAGLYLAQNQLNKTVQVIQQLKNSLDTFPNKETEAKLYKLQAAYYDKSGQSTEAFKYIKRYLQLKDSLTNVTHVPQGDVNKEYDNIKRQYEFAVLKKNDELKTLYLTVSIVLALMAIAILYLVWRNSHQSKKSLIHLTSLNKQISEHNLSMQNTLDALEQSQEDNTKMMKIVAHDLRNPMAAIVTVADLLLIEQKTNEHTELLTILKKTGNNAIELVTNLLQTNANTKVPMSNVELAELLSYSVDLMRFRAGEKKQTIVLHANPVVVLANRERLWRVMNNLIMNAIKFSPEGKTIEIWTTQQETTVLISVKDSGIGIPNEIKDEIFDALNSFKREGTAGEQSFGLGLSISKQIVEAHKGKLWFESELGKGTTFYIELPLPKEAEL